MLFWLTKDGYLDDATGEDLTYTYDCFAGEYGAVNGYVYVGY